jgi:hypothetical protein
MTVGPLGVSGGFGFVFALSSDAVTQTVAAHVSGPVNKATAYGKAHSPSITPSATF